MKLNIVNINNNNSSLSKEIIKTMVLYYLIDTYILRKVHLFLMKQSEIKQEIYKSQMELYYPKRNLIMNLL